MVTPQIRTSDVAPPGFAAVDRAVLPAVVNITAVRTSSLPEQEDGDEGAGFTGLSEVGGRTAWTLQKRRD
jgi:hypothetical protein